MQIASAQTVGFTAVQATLCLRNSGENQHLFAVYPAAGFIHQKVMIIWFNPLTF